MPSTPASFHSSDWSGGAANIENRRTVSAPNLPTISCGSTPLFFDFDIFSVPPMTDGLAVGLQRRAGDAAALVADGFHVGRVDPVLRTIAVLAVEGLGDDHALREQVGRRLVAVDQALVAHELVIEAEVQQVQDRVLDAADVLVDRRPVLRALVDLLRRAGRGVARVVPARLHEGVEGVGLALGVAAALRARGPAPVRIGLDRRGDAAEGDVFGQHDRQLVFRHRHVAALRAQDHRDRAAPVALAAHAPVAQAVVDATLAAAIGLETRRQRVQRLLEVHAVVLRRNSPASRARCRTPLRRCGVRIPPPPAPRPWCRRRRPTAPRPARCASGRRGATGAGRSPPAHRGCAPARSPCGSAARTCGRIPSRAGRGPAPPSPRRCRSSSARSWRRTPAPVRR